MITLDAQTWNLLLGAVLPALVALVTKQSASSRTKRLVLGALTAASSVGLEFSQRASFSWRDLVTSLIVQAVTAQLAYDFALKPLGITDALASVAPSVGLGGAVEPDPGTGRPTTAQVVETPLTVIPADDGYGWVKGTLDETVEAPVESDEAVTEEQFAFDSLNSLLDQGWEVAEALREAARAVENAR